MTIPFFARRRAIKRRMRALSKAQDAKARRDTRDIHKALLELRRATNECLRLGV